MVLTVSLIAVDCSLAGVATAASIAGEGSEIMSELVAVLVTLVVPMAVLNVALIRMVLRNHQFGQNANPVDVALAGKLNGDIEDKIARIDKALAPIVEDFQMRKAAEKAGDLNPL